MERPWLHIYQKQKAKTLTIVKRHIYLRSDSLLLALKYCEQQNVGILDEL